MAPGVWVRGGAIELGRVGKRVVEAGENGGKTLGRRPWGA